MPTCRNGTPLRLLLVALAVLLTTACQLRLDLAVDVNRNGGGRLGVTVGADSELLAAAAEADADPLEALAQTGEGLRADGWRVAQQGAEEGRTVTLHREFADPQEFNVIAKQLADALAADEVVLLDPLALELSDDRVSIQGAAGARPRPAVRDYGLTRRAAVELVRDEQAFDYTITVTMPGETLTTTAADPEASPLVWTVPVGERVDIVAESTRPGPPILRAAVGALLGALVAAALLWLWLRRRSRGAVAQT